MNTPPFHLSLEKLPGTVVYVRCCGTKKKRFGRRLVLHDLLRRDQISHIAAMPSSLSTGLRPYTGYVQT